MSGVESKGLFSKAGDWLSNGASSAKETMCSVDRKIDEIEDPHLRTVARVALDVAIIAIGALAFYYMSGGVNLTHPTLFKVMSMPITLGIVGLGIARLIEHNIDKEYHITAAKIASILAPSALLVGSGLVIASSWNMGYCATSITAYTLTGGLVVPGALYLYDKAYTDVWKKKPIIIEEPDLLPQERVMTNNRRTHAQRGGRQYGFDDVGLSLRRI